jgi:hypothetical protein
VADPLTREDPQGQPLSGGVGVTVGRRNEWPVWVRPSGARVRFASIPLGGNLTVPLEVTDDRWPDCARCGHPADEHHTSWFPGCIRLVEECEYWPPDGGPDCTCPGYRWPMVPDAPEDPPHGP